MTEHKKKRGRPSISPEQKAINKKISQAKWRAKNREKARATANAHYKLNKEKINTRKKLARLEVRMYKMDEYKETLRKYDDLKEIHV
jgi:hypothetical protein